MRKISGRDFPLRSTRTRGLYLVTFPHPLGPTADRSLWHAHFSFSPSPVIGNTWLIRIEVDVNASSNVTTIVALTNFQSTKSWQRNRNVFTRLTLLASHRDWRKNSLKKPNYEELTVSLSLYYTKHVVKKCIRMLFAGYLPCTQTRTSQVQPHDDLQEGQSYACCWSRLT